MIRKRNYILESDEQIQLACWLDMKKIKFTSIPNSTYTTSWNQKSKNIMEGLRGGFPDLIIIVPCGDGEKRVVCIEMKSPSLQSKNNATSGCSNLQKQWIHEINLCKECSAFVCYGFKHAKKIINGLIKQKNF